ncbi:probable metal-nicotianamine transporter YSL3 [Setaria italica]|uniref:probable metal-nicotianamine transporter YSL3 n=1 Tax=Setaria italica TaxID=4555 RepID=UPI0003509C5F|nr:probable metal-nicotianamine transporter YSL3 [Setaria italica]XP_034586671.1 probable metal-nicotianamine transporter YSL3 [Setaria viridis]
MDATIGESAPSVERAFEGQPYHGFWGQVTLRAMVVAVLLGGMFSLMTLRIYMQVGIVGAFNMPMNILSFVTLKSLVGLMRRCGISAVPFTRQENIFLQTSSITCVNVALSSGLATYVISMTSKVAKALSDNPDQRDIVDDLTMGRYGLFLVVAGLVAVMSMVPLVQIMIVDYRLLFPTGSVVAHLINSFHTPLGAYVAKLQAKTILKSFIGSFCWSLFQWFYTGGSSCGFTFFPTFGLELYKRRFSFDFSASFVGLGMIVPHVVNFGLLFGGIISGGIIYPYLESKRGQWYFTENPSTLNGINGYKDSGVTKYILKHPSLNYDDRKRLEVFIGNRLPVFGGVTGYIGIALICSVITPWIFHEIKFHHLVLLFISIPVFTFSNTYGTGLTDWSVAPTYAKFVLFLVAAWFSKPGAVIAGIAACAVAMMCLNISSQAVQDHRTGYMTLTSPRVVFAGHIYGILIGSVINPLIFLFFELNAKKTAPIGTKKSEYPCPSAAMYRAIGLLGMGGVKELPKHCLTFCFITVLITIALEIVRLVSQRKDWKLQYYIPCMTAIALPFLSGPTFTVDMTLGSILLIIWTKVNRQSAEILSSAVAAGLVSGDGIWYLPSALLGLFNVEPPMCMKFLASGKEVQIADAFLNTLGHKE